MHTSRLYCYMPKSQKGQLLGWNVFLPNLEDLASELGAPGLGRDRHKWLLPDVSCAGSMKAGGPRYCLRRPFPPVLLESPKKGMPKT